MELDLETNMKLIGKRFPYLANYEVSPLYLKKYLIVIFSFPFQVGVSNEGKVAGVIVDIFANAGISPTEESTSVMADFIDNGRQVECIG